VERLFDFDLLEFGGRTVSGLVLIPYLAWGVYTLRLRFRYHEDISPLIEAVTLLAVAAFFAVEVVLLRTYMGKNQVLHIFAMLGLLVSGAALYGPMAVSLLSQVVVDTISPGDRSKTREPRFGPTEALEREGDYEGALREYLVIARVFPREAEVHLRIGEVYMRLSKPEEAAPWFRRALGYIESPEKSLEVTNRLCEIYNRQLGNREEVGRLLEAYLSKYPEAEYSGAVRERLNRLNAPT
jgi:tetratricopeptide (TPR) repeat protein